MKLKDIAILLLCTGAAVCVVAFFTPPYWIIGKSNLEFFGECIVASGVIAGIMAIERGTDTTINLGNGRSIETHNPDGTATD